MFVNNKGARTEAKSDLPKHYSTHRRESSLLGYLSESILWGALSLQPQTFLVPLSIKLYTCQHKGEKEKQRKVLLRAMDKFY